MDNAALVCSFIFALISVVEFAGMHIHFEAGQQVRIGAAALTGVARALRRISGGKLDPPMGQLITHLGFVQQAAL